MPSFGDVFGKGSTAEQFLIWGVLMQVLQPLLMPFTTELQKLMLSAAPVVPILPNDAAEAVARGHIDTGSGRDKANDSGIGEHDFTILTTLAQHAPELSAAFELFRRGEIPAGSGEPTEASLTGAMADAGIPEHWRGHMVKLAEAWPSPAEVYNAWLGGQIEPGYAHELLAKLGVPDWWVQHGYDAQGQAPTPTQALELLNRGIIPRTGRGPQATSYEQAFLEGPWRNKWLGPFLALAEYLPPPRTVTAMYHDGQITAARAAELLTKQGLAPDLVTAYLSKAVTVHHAAEKHLAKTEITGAYADGIMTKAQAVAALVALKYSEHDARLIIELTDVHTKTAATRQAVGRVRAMYETGKLSDGEAVKLLGQLGVDPAQAPGTVAVWRLTQTHRVKVLSPAQIERAVYYELLTPQAGMTLLEGLGYDTFDAWLALSVTMKSPLPGVPRPPSPYPAPPKAK